MPGKHIAGASDEPCRRCKDPSVLVVRSEPLCHDCFARYVHTKCIKRLESFRVNFGAEQQRKILVPLSFGVSSTTLLHVLDLHLKTQKSKTGRTGFEISAIYIEDPEQKVQAAQLLDKAREQYPDHQYASLPLHDVFRLVPEDASIRSLVPQNDQKADLSPEEQFVHMINSLTSATARADVLSTLRTRLIVEHAKLVGCESILWGDSTTRLAQKTLAETAKGRGFSLPWQVSDGLSPFGLNFHYPLRDVLKKELVSYTKMAEPGLSELVHEISTGATQASTSSKNTTIDDLMTQYFESVEENFPSIVANVVRTTSKLETRPDALSDPQCSLCSMPVSGGRFGIHGWGGDQQDGDDFESTNNRRDICYGCTRSLPKATMSDKGS
ncbi:cytoplasmic tRNA 2-thiolation protein 2 [Alternaria metachromatica]|uniref:cytoplasmic tRNA 2-thiolation protein 2 n=1 Tax=Alternaria metachromatica TaxID=283354 RepID=UPI0020C2A032|nr:cytoplasmic tRNA 2-thiolation protein 2 [Alternaria metachromatica]KAI4628527.1 cytoplasmic tRNA 2-thiolation protein 2 [Alternaria metachromatica]